MIDLNENDIYKNDKITIWGKWWIPNDPDNSEVYGILEIIPNKRAILNGFCIQKNSSKENFIYSFNFTVPIILGIKIFGDSENFSFLKNESKYFFTLFNGNVTKRKIGNKNFLINKIYVDNIDCVVVGKHFFDNFGNLKFRTLSLNYEHCLNKILKLEDETYQIELGNNILLSINNKYIKVEFGQEQNIKKFLEIFDDVKFYLSFLVGYPIYPLGIADICHGSEVENNNTEFLYINSFYFNNLDVNKFIFSEGFHHLLPMLKPSAIKGQKVLHIIHIIEGLKVLQNKDLMAKLKFYFRILEKSYITYSINSEHIYIFWELFKIMEYYETKGKNTRQPYIKIFKNFLDKIELFLKNIDISLTVESILTRKYKYFNRCLNFSFPLQDDISYCKDDFINEVVNIRNYISHNNSKRLEEIGSEEELLIKLPSLNLRLKILIELCLFNEIMPLMQLIPGIPETIIGSLIDMYDGSCYERI